ncbi:MAG: hypothetical protein R2697_22650 [Ilumatobacteraceae bacterium]
MRGTGESVIVTGSGPLTARYGDGFARRELGGSGRSGERGVVPGVDLGAKGFDLDISRRDRIAQVVDVGPDALDVERPFGVDVGAFDRDRRECVVLWVRAVGTTGRHDELEDPTVGIGIDVAERVVGDGLVDREHRRVAFESDRLEIGGDESDAGEQIAQRGSGEPSQVRPIEQAGGLVVPVARQQVEPDVDVRDVRDRDDEDAVVGEHADEVGECRRRITEVLEHVAEHDDVESIALDPAESDDVEVDDVDPVGEPVQRGGVDVDLDTHHGVPRGNQVLGDVATPAADFEHVVSSTHHPEGDAVRIVVRIRVDRDVVLVGHRGECTRGRGETGPSAGPRCVELAPVPPIRRLDDLLQPVLGAPAEQVGRPGGVAEGRNRVALPARTMRWGTGAPATASIAPRTSRTDDPTPVPRFTAVVVPPDAR